MLNHSKRYENGNRYLVEIKNTVPYKTQRILKAIRQCLKYEFPYLKIHVKEVK